MDNNVKVTSRRTGFDVMINGDRYKAMVNEGNVQFLSSSTRDGHSATHFTLEFDEMICIKIEDPSNKPSIGSMKTVFVNEIHFIKRQKECPKWTHETLTFSPQSEKEEECRHFMKDIQAKFNQVAATRPKKLLILMNPIGGDRLARKMYDTTVLPLFQLAGINVELIVSERPKHLVEVMSYYNYTSVDGIVMMGGDGTLNEVMNVLVRRTQEQAGIDVNDTSAVLQPVPIPVSIIPTGTGNAFARQTTGCRDVTTSVLHIIRGKCQDYNVLSTHCDGKLVGFGVCFMALGALVDMVYVADRKLRWMKTSRYGATKLKYLFEGRQNIDTEIILSNRKPTNSDKEDERDGELKEETICQTTSYLMAWAFDRWSPGPVHNSNSTTFVYIYEKMGRLQIFRSLNNLAKRTLHQPDSGYCKVRETPFFTVKLQPSPGASPVYNEMVCLDGELRACSSPEYFVRAW